MITYHRQSGFILFMTLIIMVIMSIAGLALLRAVDNSTLVADNVGYKQAAILASDSAVYSAITWLSTNSLEADSTANGAYATSTTSLDWTGQNTTDTIDNVDWDNSLTAATTPTKGAQVTFANGNTTDDSGNRAYYVVHRLCDTAGPSSEKTTSCVTSSTQASATGSTKIGTAYGQKALTTITQVYYRITIKVIGPKNTVSYSQVFVLI